VGDKSPKATDKVKKQKAGKKEAAKKKWVARKRPRRRNRRRGLLRATYFFLMASFLAPFCFFSLSEAFGDLSPMVLPPSGKCAPVYSDCSSSNSLGSRGSSPSDSPSVWNPSSSSPSSSSSSKSEYLSSDSFV
jgi:hypothetical protein